MTNFINCGAVQDSTTLNDKHTMFPAINMTANLEAIKEDGEQANISRAFCKFVIQNVSDHKFGARLHLLVTEATGSVLTAHDDSFNDREVVAAGMCDEDFRLKVVALAKLSHERILDETLECEEINFTIDITSECKKMMKIVESTQKYEEVLFVILEVFSSDNSVQQFEINTLIDISYDIRSKPNRFL